MPVILSMLSFLWVLVFQQQRAGLKNDYSHALSLRQEYDDLMCMEGREIMDNMDSYTKVCEICENIKETYSDFGNETAVMNMAQAIINEVRRRKESFVNNTFLKVQHMIVQRVDPMMITREEAMLFASMLKKLIEQTKKDGEQDG